MKRLVTNSRLGIIIPLTALLFVLSNTVFIQKGWAGGTCVTDTVDIVAFVALGAAFYGLSFLYC